MGAVLMRIATLAAMSMDANVSVGCVEIPTAEATIEETDR